MRSPNVSVFKGKGNMTIKYNRYFRKTYFYRGIMKYIKKSFSLWQMRMKVIIFIKYLTHKKKEIFEHINSIYF